VSDTKHPVFADSRDRSIEVRGPQGGSETIGDASRSLSSLSSHLTRPRPPSELVQLGSAKRVSSYPGSIQIRLQARGWRTSSSKCGEELFRGSSKIGRTRNPTSGSELLPAETVPIRGDDGRATASLQPDSVDSFGSEVPSPVQGTLRGVSPGRGGGFCRDGGGCLGEMAGTGAQGAELPRQGGSARTDWSGETGRGVVD